MTQGTTDSSRIFVAGSGVVGAATGRGFRAAGHEVTFVDTSEARVRELCLLGLDARTRLDLSGERSAEGSVARSAEGSISPLYGIRGGAAYGGVCLPRDTNGFLGFAAGIGVDVPLLRAVVETNDRMGHVRSESVA